MASFGGEQIISTNSQPETVVARGGESRESSVEKKASMEHPNLASTLHWFAQVGNDDSIATQQATRDREEKLKITRERQNEERQKKIEELKAQAEAAQRYREQKEEERRRRIEEIRHRDTEKRQQVEERKKAIIEAEKERREYILKKNQERESRLGTKKRERSSIGFAFGSSTPRLLEPADFGTVSPSNFWGHRRSTSITNVAGASLSRRSSERELNDSGSKKRATSASGADRHEDHRRKSSSMYEVFNWGYSNDEPPKRFSLSIVGSEINIDEDPPCSTSTSHRQYVNHFSTNATTTTTTTYTITATSKEDNVDTSQYVFRSVARRKTDLMPTIPSPRDVHYGSRTSLSNTPRTPGRAFSMNRLDQLAQPIRRNGEHIRAIIERERQQQLEMLDETESLGGRTPRTKKNFINSTTADSRSAIMSRSMTHLATGNFSSSSGVTAAGAPGGGGHKIKYSNSSGVPTTFRPLSGNSKDNCKSMTQLTGSLRTSTLSTAATKKYLSSAMSSSVRYNNNNNNHTNTTLYPRYDRNTLMMSTSVATTASRSGDVTPGGSINTSRPGSAMSTSTTMSTSGYVNRRTAPPLRKPRPASIAGTGVSLDEINKLKRENKPPMRTMNTSVSSNGQTTPKRASNVMTTSTSSSRVSSLERKGSIKKDSSQPKVSSQQPKTVLKTSSSEKLKEKSKEMSENMNKTTISNVSVVASEENVNAKTKDEKNALNTVKTEETIPSATNDVPIALTNAAESTIISEYKDSSEEKIDQGNEKDTLLVPVKNISSDEFNEKNETKENSSERQMESEMTASMIAKSKITTEEEAKAALAERRRLAREEAERQAELERQRIEAERLAELKRQEEEAEKQRKFEEEALRLAELQRKAEEERLRQAIEETRRREEEERQKRDEEEKQKIEREEAEKKAKEEAEKQRIEVAERLKREEKEREERRKRVEAIMSRTRRAGSTNTPNSTPVKDNENSKTTEVTTALEAKTPQAASSDESISVGSRSSLETTTATSTPATTPGKMPEMKFPSSALAGGGDEPQNSQAIYEQSVVDKESSLMKSFSAMVIDENTKNLQQQPQQFVEVTNGKMTDFPEVIHNSVANGNGHIENINNKNDINIRQNVAVPPTNQLFDLNIESQDINNAVNFNNNNSLLATTNTLVTADSHESKDISLL